MAFEVIGLQNTQAPLRWTDPILFDEPVRDALRASDPSARQAADAVSWGLWGAQLALPVFVDLPYAWARYGLPLARDLFWQDAATLLFAGALDLALRDLVGRARPPVYDCISQGGANCIYGPEAVRSFPGGHILNSTAASVLTCTQHLHVRLYGGPWDALTCALTLASNATIAVLRVVADGHWVTDEIAGVALGALIGWGVPYVMHFHGHLSAEPHQDEARPPEALVLPAPLAVDRGGGLGVVGLF